MRILREMEVRTNRISRKDLKPGDHIYSWRTAYIYAHHGIYIGEEKVIHFTRGEGQAIGMGKVLDRLICSSPPSHSSGTPCLKCGDQSRLDGVISSCLDCFLADGDLYLFQYIVSPAIFIGQPRGGTCTFAASDSPAEVIHRASFLLQKGFGAYNIFKNNCVDFAIYCKTGLLVSTSIGVNQSGQAASFIAAADTVISRPISYLTPAAVVLVGPSNVNRIPFDIGVRPNMTKVPVEKLVR